MAASITRLHPVPRNQGIQIPGLLPVAQWIDARVLVAGVAETYTIPVDTGQTPNIKGTILRITANAGPIFIDFVNSPAVVPVADLSDGSSSIMLRTDLGPVLLCTPTPVPATMSIISSADCIVTIEAWS